MDTTQVNQNKSFEGGVFYPTGYIVAAFERAEAAREAFQTIRRFAEGDDAAALISAEQMEYRAEENLESKNLLSSWGSSAQVRAKQLQLAQRGCDFVMIHAPQEEEQTRAVEVLRRFGACYAVKYHRLTMEDLMPLIDPAALSEDNARAGLSPR